MRGFLVLDDGLADVDFALDLEVGVEELLEFGLDGVGVLEARDVQGVVDAFLVADLFDLDVGEVTFQLLVQQTEGGLDGGFFFEGDE